MPEIIEKKPGEGVITELEMAMDIIGILSISDNWFEIVHLFLEKTASILKAPFCGILLVNEKQLSVHIPEKITLDILESFKEKFCEKAAGDLNVDMDIDDILLDTTEDDQKKITTGASEKEHKILFSRLKGKKGVIGILGVSYLEDISETERKKMEFLATQGSLVIGIAGLYNRIEEINEENESRFAQISQVGQLISAFTDFDRLLTQYMEISLRAVDAEVGSIQLVTSKGEWKSQIDWGLTDKMVEGIRTPDGRLLHEVIGKDKEPVILSQMETDSYNSGDTHLLHFENFISIPLKLKEGKIIGTLNIVNAPEKKINDAGVMGFLTIIAGLAATLIENAQLYQENLKKQQMEKEIQVAKSIQENLLPQEVPKIDKMQFSAMSQPARQVGGDYYDFIEFDNNKIGIVIADVAGKGIPAALMMTILRTLFKVNSNEYRVPLETVNFLNKHISRDIADDRFITLFYLVVDIANKNISFCNAGHDPMIIYHPDEGTFDEVDTEGMPLGIFEENEFEEKNISFKENDVVAIYTDGIIEARNKKRDEYGFERFKKMIKKHSSESPETIRQKILEDILIFTEDMPQHDDLTMVIMKFQG